MGGIATESIRAAALVGHAGSGKTLLTEALLHQAGAITTPGTIERGSTVSDFDTLEKQHHHSMYTTPLCFEYKSTRIHLIDTPGSPDFLGHSISALQAVDTVVVVINAQTGMELTTSRMMDWAGRRDLCRMIVINKIDAPDIDLPDLLARIQETFGKECLPINLPAEGGTKVVDCFF